ncbi:MAG: 1-deoxy-D-xylulose-5-phosphate synthase [Candidatus Ancillula sp.]|jgi:1-deoxy-D-xylulose-5-phosphate synthase|nr:1-deoxy-D-xylulose-5-phosphate synthase [Candidatus Ancillula sp.]
MDKMLEELHNLPSSLKSLELCDLEKLSAEIRSELIAKLAEVGGHIGPNLGIVELSVALHVVFNSPVDKLVFDVSHQSLPHKILTGRYKGFKKFHQDQGISAFTNIDESEHDHFNMGHTSTSISLAAGLAKSRDILGSVENVVAIIGDGSLSGGEAFEGLNIAGDLNSNFIVIVNDNEMSIDPNSGALYKGLAELRRTNGKAENNIFKFLGFDYAYLEEGNDVGKLIEMLESVKGIDHPVVVHIHTKKGLGFPIAEKNPEIWHYHVPFNAATGENSSNLVDKKRPLIVSSTDIIIDHILEEKNSVVVVPGAPLLGRKLQETVPERYLDVGIAEGTGVAYASGIAKGGVKPYIVVASTFIQRAYDQIIQDWTLNDTPATLIVLGAGISSSDYTHVGIYDIPMLSNIANLVYLAPTSAAECKKMLNWAAKQDFPTALRTSTGDASGVEDRDVSDVQVEVQEIEQVKSVSVSGGVIPNKNFIVRSEVVKKGTRIAIIGLGLFFQKALEASEKIKEKLNIKPTVINPRFISHLDEELLSSLPADHEIVVILEDGIIEGGFGQKVSAFYASQKNSTSRIQCLIRGAKREHIDSIAYDDLMKRYRLTPEQIVDDIRDAL